jgi:LmbE family N-acetylglucosaminyl deacetylase
MKGSGKGDGMGMRNTVSRMLDGVLDRKCRPLEPPVLEGAAVVFSPHYDDESLGCGGTLIKRTALGARTKVVFMTDGSRSHRHLMPVSELTRLRKSEAVAAGSRIGLREDDLVHLGHPDGTLAARRDEALDTVAGILADFPPDVVFAPYAGEPPPDHRATTEIVEAALKRVGLRVPRLQYVVWAWHHWPRVPLRMVSRRHVCRALWDTAADNHRLLRDLNRYVDVSDVLEKKRECVGEYRSQLTRLVDDERWLTLGDVAGGEFLQWFFTPREYFAWIDP